MRVCEIFLSLLGEGTSAGYPCVILRLSECNLRCVYCDTSYAWKQGVDHSLEQVLAKVSSFDCKRVLVTGGEPLLQAESLGLMEDLCNEGYQVFLETNGSMDVSGVDPRVVKIVDLKTPGSGESESNMLENVGYLAPGDQLKVVITDESDYHWAVELLAELDVPAGVEVLLSPADGMVAPRDLASWMLRDRSRYRLQLQLHKVIWDKERRR